MIFDVAIIGAGVTGVAIARRFAIEGASVLVIERGMDILSGASKANSAILHTGFDAPPDSLELACMQEGYREFSELAERSRLPRFVTGATLVAWSGDEADKLDEIVSIAHRNGVPDCRRLDLDEIRRLEPHLAEGAHGGVVVPGEAIIDPWSPFLAYAEQAISLGAVFAFGSALAGAEREDSIWTLKTERDTFSARTVINCAGAQGDRVNALLTGEPEFQVKPRKGQFIVYDKAASDVVKGIILPVPNDRTKGVVITRTAFGNVLVGPTAEEQEERDRPATSAEGLAGLLVDAARLVPALATIPVTATYAGIRPATEKKEYRISSDIKNGLIVVGGIRSTGLTASLGIANYVFRLSQRPPKNIQPPELPRVPILADAMGRDWTRPGYGEIVCHCEMVTDREIRAAFEAPLPPRDFGGLKRRTRCAMGRCQGFHCTAKIAAMAGDRFSQAGGADR